MQSRMNGLEGLSDIASRAPVLKGIAERTFPNGTVGRCLVCGKKRHCATSEIAVWLLKGFPKHCGRAIDLDNPWITRPTK